MALRISLNASYERRSGNLTRVWIHSRNFRMRSDRPRVFAERSLSRSTVNTHFASSFGFSPNTAAVSFARPMME
jgi:hypothetical protein